MAVDALSISGVDALILTHDEHMDAFGGLDDVRGMQARSADGLARLPQSRHVQCHEEDVPDVQGRRYRCAVGERRVDGCGTGRNTKMRILVSQTGLRDQM